MSSGEKLMLILFFSIVIGYVWHRLADNAYDYLARTSKLPKKQLPPDLYGPPYSWYNDDNEEQEDATEGSNKDLHNSFSSVVTSQHKVGHAFDFEDNNNSSEKKIIYPLEGEFLPRTSNSNQLLLTFVDDEDIPF